ncbi:MAG: TVP38/TMEM64 family protein [Planctomycetota bacterium]|nr:TVP38/TMEM64 family protein [Planctomycetota bacterium]
MNPPTPEPTPAAARVKTAALLVCLLCLVALARILPVRAGVDAAAAWIAGLGWWGPLVFGAIYVAGTVAFFPCTLLGLASAPLLGLGTAMATVSLSSTLGAALAFLVARYLVRDSVEGLARRHPRFAAVDRAVGREGWKVVALVRLATVIPYNLSNYAFGVTSVRFEPYVLATWLAMMPGTFTFIYLGYLIHKGLAVQGSSPLEWLLLGTGLLAALAARWST